jgi:hypothetical protein
MLEKKDFNDDAVAATLRKGHRQRIYFEQIAVFRHMFMNFQVKAIPEDIILTIISIAVRQILSTF